MIMEVIPIEGNGSRESHKGIGFTESDTMYTLNTTEVHAIAFRKTAHPRNSNEPQGYTETEIADTLNVFDNTEARTPILIVSPDNGYVANSSGDDIAGTLDSYYYLGCGARGGREREFVCMRKQ